MRIAAHLQPWEIADRVYRRLTFAIKPHGLFYDRKLNEFIVSSSTSSKEFKIYDDNPDRYELLGVFDSQAEQKFILENIKFAKDGKIKHVVRYDNA